MTMQADLSNLIANSSDGQAPEAVPKPAVDVDPKAVAWMLIRTQAEAAETMQRYLPGVIEPEAITALTVELHQVTRRVNDGNLSDLEGALVGQAQTLNQIFFTLSRQAWLHDRLPFIEGFLKLALRAQNQCRATIETLATIKNPPNVAFVKQANVAQNQQVNNYAPTSADPLPAATPLSQLEQLDDNRLDTGATTTASGADPAMATVGEVHRPEDRPR